MSEHGKAITPRLGPVHPVYAKDQRPVTART